MTRAVRDSKYDTRESRRALPISPRPYFRDLAEGLHLGYRKGARKGVWVVRRYVGDQRYVVETIGEADDHRDADGVDVLTFRQAQDKARALDKQADEKARKASQGAPITVATAIDEYLAKRLEGQMARRDNVSSRRDAHSRLNKHVLVDGALAAKPLSELTADDLLEWRHATSRRLGETTVRRVIHDFKAALNMAAVRYRKRLPAAVALEIKAGLASTGTTATVSRDNQILSAADIRRIIAAAKEFDDEAGWHGDAYRLIIVLAATGARFSQLARMRVADVQTEKKRLMIPVSRKGRGEKQKTHIAFQVGNDVMEALRPALINRKGVDALFLRPRWRLERFGSWVEVDREPWTSASEMTRPWVAALERAGMPGNIIPYALRHSSIVRGLGSGLSVRHVAALHDTSAAMIELHYSAYIVDAMEELAARAVIPLAPSAPLTLRSVS